MKTCLALILEFENADAVPQIHVGDVVAGGRVVIVSSCGSARDLVTAQTALEVVRTTPEEAAPS
jgi:hypothetical protein